MDFLPKGLDLRVEDFRFSQPQNVSLAELENYDDFGSWPEWEQGELLELDSDEILSELEYFRGGEWAKRAWKWIKSGTCPPIIVADLPDVVGIADGRGRTSIGIGMDWDALPTIWMTQS
jgi:hypothetical protein